MQSRLKKLLGTTSVQKQQSRKQSLYSDLIRREAKIGGEIFGPVPVGGRREFFCLDEHTWVWHEESANAATRTTRYNIRPDGVLKSQDGGAYQPISAREARHLRQAAELYYQRVRTEIYESTATLQ